MNVQIQITPINVSIYVLISTLVMSVDVQMAIISTGMYGHARVRQNYSSVLIITFDGRCSQDDMFRHISANPLTIHSHTLFSPCKFQS